MLSEEARALPIQESKRSNNVRPHSRIPVIHSQYRCRMVILFDGDVKCRPSTYIIKR